MKRYTRAIAAVLALCLLMLGGCQPTAPSEPSVSEDAVYSVSVKLSSGTAATGVVVKFLRDGVQEAMVPVNGEGKAEKKLPDGEYSVELIFTDSDADWYYDRMLSKLSPENTSMEITLYAALQGDGEPVFDRSGESRAYAVNVGHTYVKLEGSRRNYFLFSPKTAGIYRFSVSDPKAVIGYYGYTSYIREETILPLEDGAITMTVTASMVGSEGGTIPHVIGIDANGLEDCILQIERLGDPAYSIEEDAPWTIYEPTVTLSPYTLPAGKVHQFDLTAASDAYKLVFNEEDKTYHLNSADGPQVLVRLSKSTDYLPAISEICTTTGVKKYFYDENGEFVKREDYTSCLQIYSNTDESSGKAVYVDKASGLYPLTEDLKYIIQNHGEYVGWWDKDSHGYLFQDADGNNMIDDLNPDIAWLFLCCYLEQ